MEPVHDSLNLLFFMIYCLTVSMALERYIRKQCPRFKGVVVSLPPVNPPYAEQRQP